MSDNTKIYQFKVHLKDIRIINKSVQKQEQVLDFTKYVNNIRKKK
ncbi:hypothetical protein [Candidatus Tisiphia endosymbiont of Nedyus quadrimaculatus]